MKYNEFRDLCHSTSHACGWWRGAERYGSDADYDPDRLNIPTKIALVHTEVREAHDFYLSGENDDHLPHRPGAAVELGDVVIRVGDTAGYLQIDLDAAVEAVRGEFRAGRHGDIMWRSNSSPSQFGGYSGSGSILQLHNFAADATEAFRSGKTDEFNRSLGRIVVLSELICERNGWDLLAISREKVAYNAIREDHKRQVREAEGGKII